MKYSHKDIRFIDPCYLMILSIHHHTLGIGALRAPEKINQKNWQSAARTKE
jgi:hypothetical protein